jgi:hypothetical protein
MFVFFRVTVCLCRVKSVSRILTKITSRLNKKKHPSHEAHEDGYKEVVE